MKRYHDQPKQLTEDVHDVHPIRASLARLPAWTQHFLTWLTGYALPLQRPLLPNSPAIQIAVAVIALLGGIGLGMAMSSIVFEPINYFA